MEGYAYYNGKIGRCDDISIPLTDRIIYFGDGVYDVVIGHSGKLFLLNDHIDRLFFGMKSLNMVFTFTKEYLISLINKLIDISRYESYLVYISCSRSLDERKHSYLDCTSTNLLITIKEFIRQNNDTLKLIVTADNRYNYCNIKTTNLLPAIIAATAAEAEGCDEAVFIRDGIITECACSNIFIIEGNKLITHPESSLILSGITRKYLIKIAAEYNINIIERGFTLEELLNADEVIITSTTKLIKRAYSVNGYIVGGKNPKMFFKLSQAIEDSYKNM